MRKLGITESQFQAQVIELAQILGWMEYHAWRSFHSPKGWPDLVLLKHVGLGVSRLVFLELKTGNRKMTPAQQDWLNCLAEVPGVVAWCVHPEDWDIIQAMLRGEGEPSIFR